MCNPSPGLTLGFSLCSQTYIQESSEEQGRPRLTSHVNYVRWMKMPMGGDKLQQKTLDLTVQAVYNYMLMSKKIQLMYLGSTAYIACLLFLRQGSKWLRA